MEEESCASVRPGRLRIAYFIAYCAREREGRAAVRLVSYCVLRIAHGSRLCEAYCVLRIAYAYSKAAGTQAI